MGNLTKLHHKYYIPSEPEPTGPYSFKGIPGYAFTSANNNEGTWFCKIKQNTHDFLEPIYQLPVDLAYMTMDQYYNLYGWGWTDGNQKLYKLFPNPDNYYIYEVTASLNISYPISDRVDIGHSGSELWWISWTNGYISINTSDLSGETIRGGTDTSVRYMVGPNPQGTFIYSTHDRFQNQIRRLKLSDGSRAAKTIYRAFQGKVDKFGTPWFDQFGNQSPYDPGNDIIKGWDGYVTVTPASGYGGSDAGITPDGKYVYFGSGSGQMQRIRNSDNDITTITPTSYTGSWNISSFSYISFTDGTEMMLQSAQPGSDSYPTDWIMFETGSETNNYNYYNNTVDYGGLNACTDGWTKYGWITSASIPYPSGSG